MDRVFAVFVGATTVFAFGGVADRDHARRRARDRGAVGIDHPAPDFTAELRHRIDAGHVLAFTEFDRSGVPRLRRVVPVLGDEVAAFRATEFDGVLARRQLRDRVFPARGGVEQELTIGPRAQTTNPSCGAPPASVTVPLIVPASALAGAMQNRKRQAMPAAQDFNLKAPLISETRQYGNIGRTPRFLKCPHGRRYFRVRAPSQGASQIFGAP